MSLKKCVSVYMSQIKPRLLDVEGNIEILKDEILCAIEKESNIIIFPELALTGYLMEEGTYDIAIEEIPKEILDLSYKISIIFGAVELAEDMFYYNTAYFLEDGVIKSKHRKLYPPTYGLFDERRYFKAGENIECIESKYGKYGLLICEDIFHQSSTYILGQKNIECLFVIANSPTRIDNEGISIKEQWEALCRASSITNNYYTVMVNRVGVEDGVSFWGGSMAFSPNGNKLISLKENIEDNGVINISKKEIIRAKSYSSLKDENKEMVKKILNR